jgi:hypothetical protein
MFKSSTVCLSTLTILLCLLHLMAYTGWLLAAAAVAAAGGAAFATPLQRLARFALLDMAAHASCNQQAAKKQMKRMQMTGVM